MSLFAKRLFPAGIAALLLLAASSAYSQGSRIQGQVMDSNRRPVPDVYVELLNDVETVIRRMKTDGGGTFFFGNLISGRYLIRARPFGTNLEEQTQEVEINGFIGGRQVADMQQRDFYLKVKKNPADANDKAPGVVFAQDVSAEAKKAYDGALADLESNRADQGIQGLRNAIMAFPKYFLALERLGVELLKRQKYDEAIQLLERAVAVNEKSGNCWYGLSYSYFALDQTAKAVDTAKKASTLSPDSADIALMLGISLRKVQQYDEAEEALVKAKKLADGKKPDILWNLALLYAHNLKKYKLAADELEEYLKLSPNHPDTALLKKLIEQYRNQS